jgi:hypothetical protein
MYSHLRITTLEKVRAGEVLSPKDNVIHDAALVSTLRQLHDDLDAAVADAYGWPWPLTDAEILERVVALNAARAAEEAKGITRWLRPGYQKPLFERESQAELELVGNAPDSKSTVLGKLRSPKEQADGSSVQRHRKAGGRSKVIWPRTLPERAKAVEVALSAAEHPLAAVGLAKLFTRAKPHDVQEILDTLVALGRARTGDEKGTYIR